MSGFAELGALSNFTFLEGASHPHELVEAAVNLGHAALGIADRNSFAGLVRGHVAAAAGGMVFVPGCRIALEDGTEYLAWPTDRAAYGRLTRLLSEGRMHVEKGECQIGRDALIAAADGQVLAIVPPAPDPAFLSMEGTVGREEPGRDAAHDVRAGGIASRRAGPRPESRPGGPAAASRAIQVMPGAGTQATPLLTPPRANGFAARLRRDAEVFRRRLALPLFVAASHRFDGADRKRLDALTQFGQPLLAAGGTRFHAARRRRLADTVAAIRLGCTVNALGYHAVANAEAHLKPEAEMRRLFAGHADAIDNTMRVADACGFSMADLAYEYPDEILDPGLTPQQTLERRVAAAVDVRWPDGVAPRIAAQIAHELALIAQLDYAPYFLTVHEIVRFAESVNILCQGRGSAANSAVCYALGITAVAPDKHDLLFERFISANRNEPPDIDVDFEHERREEVIQHIYTRYGRDRAAIAATVVRYRDRSAIREVGRAMGLSDDITGKLAKSVWNAAANDYAGIAAEHGLDAAADQRLRLACELAEELTGFPRHLSTHVGGFVITRGPLVELAVVTKAAMPGRHTIEWDKDDIEALRIMKVDVLALGMLTCIRRAFDLIAHAGGPRLTLASVPQDDPATYAMLRRADSIGVFQVESRAQMNMLPRLKPEKFYDLVIEVAIVRPGPIQGDMVHPYLRRKAGLEPVTYPSGALQRVLEKTLGVPLFQEQAMQIAIVGAGFAPERADQLRRAMATFRHVGTIGLFRIEFLEGMARNGYDAAFAERCFGQIEGFGTYGFPESHAASFAGLVYVSSWIKCHYPAAFAAALLNSQPMGFYAPAQIVRDAREHGVEIRDVDVTASDYDCTLEDGALRLGLRLVEGLDRKAGQRIEMLRGLTPPAALSGAGEGVLPRRHPTLTALIRAARLSRADVEKLAAADAFRGMGLNRRDALWEAAAVEAAAPIQPDLLEADATLPGATAGEQTVLDYGATGLTLRHHPLALLRPRLTADKLADTRILNAARKGTWIRLPGLVLVRQRPGSAKGVVFFTVEDEHGIANLVVYPDRAQQFRSAVVAARLLVAEGRVERQETSPTGAPAPGSNWRPEVPIIHLIVHRLIDRSDLLGSLAVLDAPDDGRAWDRNLAHADEVRRGGRGGQYVARPSHYPAGVPKLPPSRDFH